MLVSCPGTCARHYRYDALGRRTSSYNLGGQVVASCEPATGQTGTGRNTFLYPSGPQTDVTVFDEGERVAVTGGTEPVSYGYDALCRQISRTDGNGLGTRFTHNSVASALALSYNCAIERSCATTATFAQPAAVACRGTGATRCRREESGTSAMKRAPSPMPASPMPVPHAPDEEAAWDQWV